MKTKLFFLGILFWVLLICPDGGVEAQTEMPPEMPSAVSAEKLNLAEAAMCEVVKDLNCHNQAVVFSVSVGKVSCFSIFDPVPEKTEIYHNWYKRDSLTTQQRLVLEPPVWRTYSSIQLRESDKGPWHVEIIGPKGKVLKVLRFSITD